MSLVLEISLVTYLARTVTDPFRLRTHGPSMTFMSPCLGTTSNICMSIAFRTSSACPSAIRSSGNSSSIGISSSSFISSARITVSSFGTVLLSLFLPPRRSSAAHCAVSTFLVAFIIATLHAGIQIRRFPSSSSWKHGTVSYASVGVSAGRFVVARHTRNDIGVPDDPGAFVALHVVPMEVIGAAVLCAVLPPEVADDDVLCAVVP